MSELSVEFTASIKKLESALKKVKKDLVDTGEVAEKSAGKISKTGDKGAKGITKFGKSTANALPATQEFSRVIQDLPFGIQGVGNNIQQLTANFGNLSKSAGGTLPALKLMVSSLAGPAGILLAVSVVTSALTFFQNNLGKTRTEAEKLAEQQKKLAEGLEKYRERLTGVNRARLEGNRSSAEELVQLRNLRNQIENTTLSLAQREDGIKRLRNQFPAYFKDVKDESLLNGSLQKTYDSLTESIIKRAKATAASDLLVENAKKEFTLRSQLEALEQKISKEEISRGKAREDFTESTKQSYLAGVNPAANEYVKRIAAANDLLKEQTEIQKQLGIIGADNARLTQEVSANITVIPEIDTTKSIKGITDKFKNEFQNLDDIFGLNRAAQNSLDKLTPIFDNFKTTFNKFGDVIGFELKDAVSKIKPQLAEIEGLMVAFSERATDIVNNGIVSAFSAIGQGIGDAIANGGNVFKNIGANLLKVVGQVATQLGEAAIGIGVAMAAIKLSFSNPFTAIAAGVALVALGAALGGIANNALNGSSNVGAGSRSVSGQGSSTGSIGGGSVANSGFGGGKVVFEIAGTKLLGVLRNTQESNLRLGGNIGG